jgi:hypothetical protein
VKKNYRIPGSDLDVGHLLAENLRLLFLISLICRNHTALLVFGRGGDIRIVVFYSPVPGPSRKLAKTNRQKRHGRTTQCLRAPAESFVAKIDQERFEIKEQKS